MSNFLEKVQLNKFTLAALDTTEIDEISAWLPRNAVIDLNTAEQGVIYSLHGQNVCQEHIAKIDVWIGYKESDKNRVWREAVSRAKEGGWKTSKDKEWFAQADEEYLETYNELVLAKAAKKYFENKASYFSSWHYAFKTFLNRDYSLERLGNLQGITYNKGTKTASEQRTPDDENEEWCDKEDNMWE